MLFLGTTFFSGRNTIDPSSTMAKDINKVSISNGTFSQIYISKNPDISIEKTNDGWDYDTVLKTDYSSGRLDAGNSGFSLLSTDYVVVKCRKIGTFNWTVIYTKEINDVEDFKINIKDYFRQSNSDYEYMIVSVCNGIENSYVTEMVKSIFNGMYVCDKDNLFGTIFNIDSINTETVNLSSVLELANNKYPSISSNSSANYETGNASGVFMQLNEDNEEIDSIASAQYLKSIKNWLNNKKPKILKFYDGRIWLISVSGNIAESAVDTDNDIRKLSFNWIEIGNVESMETLYNFGLSTVGREWWY